MAGHRAATGRPGPASGGLTHLTVVDHAVLRDLALDIARAVGPEIGRRAGRVDVSSTKSTASDLVTEMDRWSEDQIVSRILDARPGDSILGEEGTGVEGTSNIRWVVDPIDGTTDFVYGHPGFSNSIGVEVDSGGAVFTVEGGQIVLSSGAIGSPHLLLLSGVGPAEQLRRHRIPVVHDLPGVGQNLRDHPIVAVVYKVKPDHPQDPEEPRYQLALRYTATGSDDRNDMQILPSAFSSPIGAPDPYEQEGVRFTCVLELANGFGELTLASNDPAIQPHLNYNYLKDPWDRERLRECVRLAMDLVEHPLYKDIIEERLQPKESDIESDDALDDWMLRTTVNTTHISGTCKLGPTTDQGAVVDQYCRVHGLENIRVADASVMPNVVRANTNSTTIMIGERVADWIKGS